MNRQISERKGEGFRISLFLLLAFAALVRAAAQTGGPPEAAPVPMLSFTVRSAFSLSPADVKLLQPRTGDKGEMPGEKAAGEAARSQAPAPAVDWSESLVRSLPLAAPLDLRLMGKNLVILVQVLPMGFRDPIVDLFIQGQIWVKNEDNSLSYKTTMQSMSVPLGTRIYFYPLGADLKSGAAVAVEIKVDRPAER